MTDDNTKSAQTVVIKGGDGKVIVKVDNIKLPEIDIQKVDSRTGAPLAGFTFTLRETDDTSAKQYTYTTDSTGLIKVPGLKPGIYTITETACPPQYLLDNPTSQTIQVNGGEVKLVKFSDTLKPTLVITKENGTTGKPLAGATFTIAWDNPAGGMQTLGTTYKTDANGLIIIPYVNPGWYTITETAPAPGSTLPSNPTKRIYLSPGDNSYSSSEGGMQGGVPGLSAENVYGISIASGSLVAANFTDYESSSIIVKKIDANTGAMLQGATFDLIEVSGQMSGTGGSVIATATTDSSGVFAFCGLQPGHYLVKETQAPANYIIGQTNIQNATIAPDQTSSPELVFNNYPYAAINITKTDAVTGTPLNGAEFSVTDSSGANIGSTSSYQTGSNGAILIPNVPPGSYVITETKAPAGYVLDKTPKTILIGTDGKTYQVSFADTPVAGILILKQDAQTGKPLAGAVFKVTDASGAVVGNNAQYKTDANGEVLVSNLAPGSYIVTEMQAPSGYAIDHDSQTVVVGNLGQPYKVTFTDSPASSLEVYKGDDVTKAPLAGAVFMITDSRGTAIGTNGGIFTTDATGNIPLITGLTTGTYSVTELTPPRGYQLPVNPTQTINIDADGKTYTLHFYDTKIMGLQIFKVDEANNAPLHGAEFQVKTVTGAIVGSYTTDSNGSIDITKDANGNPLPSGDYVVTESKAPQGYAIDETPKTVTVAAGNKASITFKNQKLQGVVIQKVDSQTHAPLQGAQFEVWTTNGSSDTSVSASQPAGTLISTYTTDVQGLISVATLPNGTYMAKEVKAPDGYRLDASNQVFTVTAGQPTTVTFSDTKIYGIEIIKLDSQTKQPLKGAVFNVYNIGASGNVSVASGTPAGQLIGTYTTDVNGLIDVAVPDGEYEVVETNAPDGYQIDNAKQDVVVKAGQKTSVTFSDTKVMGLQIIKLDSQSKKPLQGAVFNINKTNSDATGLTADSSPTGDLIGTYTTDQNGQINIGNLPSGEYTVTEVTAPQGYVIDNAVQNVKIEAGRLASITFTDTPASGLQITKLNSETKQPIGGVVFSLSRMDGTKIGDYTTDNNGSVFIPNLDTGWYTVVETEAAYGYLLDATPHNIEVKKGQNAALEIVNKPMSGLLIVKTDAQTGKPLQGVVFDVKLADGQRVAGNILDQNQANTYANSPNTTSSANGDISGSFTTDANGRILINSLPAGQYTVTETKALPGYELDTDVHDVTIVPGKLVALQLTNTQKAGLRILKIDSLTKKGIYNAEFMVFDKSGKAVGTYYSDNNGFVDVTGALTAGRYTIRETRPAAGYYADDVPKTVNFEAGKYTEITWENTPRMGQIQVTKTSADDNEISGLPAGTPLQGAVFEAYEYKSGNLVDRFVSGDNGRAVSKPLLLGRYIVKEVQAPQWYKLNTKELDVDVEFATQIVKLDFSDYSANTGVTIKKTGGTQTMPNSPISYDIKVVRNDSTVPLTSFYWRDVLPTNAIRLNKITTGTYNQSLRYKITATTNRGDIIIVTDNLSTTVNNVVDFSNASLGLGSDEYVTSFTLMFGTVKAGFCTVEQPKIFATTLSSLQNGFVFSNKADAGGKYGNEWVINSSAWSVNAYRPQSEGRLPRTGY